MLRSITPFSLIRSTIRKHHQPTSFFLSIDVITSVDFPIWPMKDSLTMHDIGFPFTLIPALVRPFIYSGAFNFSEPKLSLVDLSILPIKDSPPVLNTILVLTLVVAPVGPMLSSFSILQIIIPTAPINRTIFVVVYAFTLFFIITPVAYICVAIKVD